MSLGGSSFKQPCYTGHTHTAPPASGSLCVCLGTTQLYSTFPRFYYLYISLFPSRIAIPFALCARSCPMVCENTPATNPQETGHSNPNAGGGVWQEMGEKLQSGNLHTASLFCFVLLRYPFLIKTQFNSTSSWKQDHNTWPVLSKSFVEQFPRINSCVSVSVWLKH